LEGTFEDKALSFYKKAIENPQWLTNKLVEFAQYQNNEHKKERLMNRLYLTISKQLNYFVY
jgi:cell shape-determining protein MreC